MPVFTTKYTSISRKLINNTHIIYGGNSVEAISQWDTGATCTCISHDIVKKLGLIPTSMTRVQTPSGNKDVNVYLVDVALPSKAVIRNVLACESEIGDQGIDALIGMNIINLGDFAVSNNKKTYFTFRVPSEEHIDFIVEDKKKKIINKSHSKKK